MSSGNRAALVVRDILREDLDRVLEIENRAYEHPWSRRMLEAELDHDWSTVLLACEQSEGEILGFAVFWTIVDEVHVLDVAVDPAHRRRGVGAVLVDGLLGKAREQGARIASLEVRRGNLGAQELYQGKGFRPVGLRPRYYVENGEDAIIMERTL